MKIIYITTHIPPYELYADMPRPEVNIDISNTDWIGFWRGDWGDKLGKIIKGHYPDVEFEYWQPDRRADKIYEHRFEDGILHRRFPADIKKHFFGVKLVESYYSSILINELRNNIYNDTVIHLAADYNYFGAKLHRLLFKNLPIVSWFLLNIDMNNPDYYGTNLIQKFHRYIISCQKKNHLKNINFPILFDYYSKEVIEKLIKKRSFVLTWSMIDFNFWDINLDRIILRKEYNIPEKQKVFLSSSRLIESKQIDKLIEVFSKLNFNDFKLFITGAGENDYIEYLNNIINKNNLNEKITLLGYLDEISLKKYYILSDYFVSSSVMEGGPTSGLYALALDKKMIVTDTGIVANILKEYNSGIILPSKEYDKWEVEFKNILEGSDIQVVGREIMKSKFDTSNLASNLIEIYREAISGFKKTK